MGLRPPKKPREITHTHTHTHTLAYPHAHTHINAHTHTSTPPIHIGKAFMSTAAP